MLFRSSYDAMVYRLNGNTAGKQAAVEEIRRQAGLRYDPNIADIFVEVMSDESEV